MSKIPESAINLILKKQATVRMICKQYNVSRQAVHERMKYAKRPKPAARRWQVLFLCRLGFDYPEITYMLGYKNPNYVVAILRDVYKIQVSTHSYQYHDVENELFALKMAFAQYRRKTDAELAVLKEGMTKLVER